MAKIKLDIVTPEKVAFSDEVNMIIARTTNGDVGILPGHAPLIAGLDIWILRLLTDDGERQMALCGGLLEVQPDKATILATCAESPEEIDSIRAQAAKDRAETRLKDRQPGIDITRAEAALKRAVLRLRLARKEHKM